MLRTEGRELVSNIIRYGEATEGLERCAHTLR